VSGIHQFVPMLHVGDAVGRHTVAVQSVLLARGYESEIYVELEDEETAARTRPAASYAAGAPGDDLLVYQFATASDLAGLLIGRPERLVVNYHNVTPAHLFAPWDNGLARHQDRARAELGGLARRAALGVAVSELNRADLVALGFAATAVVPPVVDLADPGASSPRPARRRGARWLSVGRLAPNKAVEDTIAALLAYRARFDPEAELEVVGKPALPAYSAALRAYAAELGLAGAVHFAGRVDDAALAAAYDGADVLVVSSEHEGFCLPVVEAMAHGVPVVAFDEGALGEVLGDAGVLLNAKDPLTVAEAVHRVQHDEGWRAGLVAAGRRRLPALRLAEAGPMLADLLVAAQGAAPWPGSVAVRAQGAPGR
jgi:glycosyltransferase involved in cell wall biosynthesis